MARDQSDKDVFAQKFLLELGKQRPGIAFRYDREHFRLVYGEKDEATLNLANVYDHYSKAPIWKRSGVFSRHARTFAQMTDTPEKPSSADARSQMVLKVRERIVMEGLVQERKSTGKEGAPFAYKVVGEHLTLEVALDLPTMIRSVRKEDLADWGMSFDDAIAQANQNLLAAGANRFRPAKQGVFVSAWNDDYDCCRLVLPEVIASVPVKGRPVAMIPNRNCLILTGSEDTYGLVNLARVAEDALKQPSSMCGLAFRLDNAWVPFLPGREHPAYIGLHRLAVRSFYEYYTTQKNWLIEENKKADRDVFVASPLLIQNKATGDHQSLATWTEHVPTLLPRTDFIGFMRPLPGGKSEAVGKVRWEPAHDLLCDLMVPQDMYPERFLVKSFPSVKQLEQLPVESLA